MGARWYDPVTSSFASLDPVLDASSQVQLNGYTYAGDNPVGSSDPTGAHPTDCTGGGCEGNVDGGNPYTGGIAGVSPPPSSGTATAPASGGGSRRSCVYKFCRVGSPASDPQGNWVNVAAGAVGSVVGADQGLRCQFMPWLCAAMQGLGIPSEGDLYQQALGGLGISHTGSDYTAGYIAGSVGMLLIPGAGEEEAAAAADGAAARVADDAPATSCLVGQSFTPDTGVLLPGARPSLSPA